MTLTALPRYLKRALDLVESDPTRMRTTRDFAAACGVPVRTMQRHFRRFAGRTPTMFQRELRLERVRSDLLRAPPGASVTDIAMRWGFSHLGRFAVRYRERYGESPSATLRLYRSTAPSRAALPRLSPRTERPTIAVLPFRSPIADTRRASTIAEGIAEALCRLRWMFITAPANAAYHLRGRLRRDVRNRLEITVMLVEARTGRYLWAACCDGEQDDAFAFQDDVATRIVCAIAGPLRDAEIDRALRMEGARLNAWDLAMRALRHVVSFEPASEGMALELLERAMELAPHDALPVALASWCHGLRGGHHFTPRPEEDRKKARILAARAAQLDNRDSLAETLLAAGYTLAHDLATAATHVERALALDGGSAWAWGRSGWIKAYGGEAADAIERFQIARALAPRDPLGFLCAIGIGGAHFEAGRYHEAVRWYTQARAEHASTIWNNRFLAPAYALTGRRDAARQTLAELLSAYPDLTIAQVRSGLPLSPSFLDRAAEGLESAGMRP